MSTGRHAGSLSQVSKAKTGTKGRLEITILKHILDLPSEIMSITRTGFLRRVSSTHASHTRHLEGWHWGSLTGPAGPSCGSASSSACSGSGESSSAHAQAAHKQSHPWGIRWHPLPPAPTSDRKDPLHQCGPELCRFPIMNEQVSYTKTYSLADSYSSWNFPDIAGLFPNDDFRCYFVLGEIFIPGFREFEKRGEEGFPIFNEPYLGFSRRMWVHQFSTQK